MNLVENRYKVYVDVSADFDVMGRIRPRAIHWDSGLSLEIDRVTDVRQAASLKAGGCGTRYTCLIEGHERYLFYEDGRWFIESHRPLLAE